MSGGGRYDAAARRRYADRRALIDSIKVERGCADCGYRDHPAALHFDHRDPSKKAWGIATNLSRRWERLIEEIAKCDVRCSNCHAIRTYTVPGASGLPAACDKPASASLFGESA